jgi:ATP-binding cassette, subfamily B, bacterial PglK
VRIYNIWPLSSLKKRSIALPITLLSRRDRILLIAVISVTLLLAILDLLGVLLIGVIGSLSITGISTGQMGDRVSKVIQFLTLDKLDLESQVIAIGLIAATLLIAKTLLSLLLVRRTLFFMARRAAVMSSDLVKRYFTIPVSSINQRSAQNSIYALTSGVNSIMVGVIGAGVALISDIALLIVMSAGLFLIDPITTIGAATIFGFLAIFLYKIMNKKMQRLGEQQGVLHIESAQTLIPRTSSKRSSRLLC